MKFLLTSPEIFAKILVIFLSISLFSASPGNSATPYDPNTFQSTVSQMEDSRQKMDAVLQAKAKVIDKLENLSFEGHISGSINGEMVEHSPLSMAVLGLIAGGLMGGGLGALVDIPFLTTASGNIAGGAGVGAAIGSVSAPFIPTGTGNVRGSVRGSLVGKGYQILSAASVFRLEILDRVVLKGLRDTVAANPGYNYSGCASTVMSLLTQIEQDEKTLNEVEIEDFLANLAIYNAGITKLRAMKSSVATLPISNQIENTVSYYEEWIREKKIVAVSVAALKPIYDLQKKVIIRDKIFNWREYSAELGNGQGYFKDFQNNDLRFWIKSPTYPDPDYAKDFGKWRQSKYGVRREDFDKVIVLIPKIVNNGLTTYPHNNIRAGEIVPAFDSDKILTCSGNNREEAVDFLLRTSKSYDFFLTNPGKPNFRARY